MNSELQHPNPQSKSPAKVILVHCTKATLSALKESPILWLSLQLPLALLDLVEILYPKFFEQATWQQMVLYLSGFSILSIVSTALTFAAIFQHAPAHGFRLQPAWEMVKTKLPTLFAASLILTAMAAMGIVLLIAPAVLLLAWYGFTPAYILTEPAQPLSHYFYRSKKLAKTRLQLTLFLVVCYFGWGAISMLVGSVTNSFFTRVVPEAVLPIATCLVQIAVSLSFGAVADIWLSYYFLKLKHEEDLPV